MLGLLESDTKRKSLEGDDDPTMREYGLEILALALPLPVWEERRGGFLTESNLGNIGCSSLVGLELVQCTLPRNLANLHPWPSDLLLPQLTAAAAATAAAELTV